MEIIAHRGNNNHEYKENTLEAILASINKEYVAGVEIDIRITKDNHLVVIHDYLINEVSTGVGSICDMTLKELQKYNFGTKEYPAKIATLDDVLKNITNNKKIIIELKEESNDFIKLVEVLDKTLKKYPKRNILLCSFNYKLCQYIKKNYNYKIGLLIGIKLNIDKFYNNLNFNSINYRHLNKIIFKFKHNYVWTINDEKMFKKLKKKIIKYNIGIITDKPYLIKEFI